MSTNCNQTGIYQIRNILNGRIYVGSAGSKGGVQKRWADHVDALDGGYHPNRYLQSAWRKYGSDMFVFEILEEIDLPMKQILEEREQHWMDTLKAYGEGYNLRPKASSNLGFRQPEQAREKIRVAARGISDVTRAKMSAARRGVRKSQAHRDKIGAGNSKTYLLIATRGEEYLVTNLSSFCEGRNLGVSALVSVANGRATQHKGWTCRRT